MAHPLKSQVFYETDIARMEAAGGEGAGYGARLEHARTELRWYQRGTRKLPKADEDLSWLDAWLTEALPWLVLHYEPIERGEHVTHIRLLKVAPEELKQEPRIWFTTYNNDSHINLFFSSRRARIVACDFIRDRQVTS